MRDLLPNPFLLALGVAILSYLIVFGIKKLFSTKIGRFIKRPRNRWDEIVVFSAEKTNHLFLIVTSLYVGTKFLPHMRLISYYSNRIFFIAVMWQVAIWSHHLLEKWISSTITRRTRRNPAAASSISLIQLTSRMLLFSVIFLFTLSNLGIKITTIIAGLGVGGIAVALALQKILGDLFSSLSIVLDKPFMVGDFIVVDQYLGEVEKIGLKTTRIRSLTGEQIIISNSDILATRIRNYQRLKERRVSFVINLRHQSKTDDIKKAVSGISAIIRTKEKIRLERCHLTKISPSSLDIETVYWVLSDDFELHIELQHHVLLDICKFFELEKLAFAYPTQTLHMEPVDVLMRGDLKDQQLAQEKQTSLS
ncbi:MAG TPA: mechanosensitive ion channel family protein [Bacteriovoracaceae bacterium]|nr:mechanosensitive ion channel family protein [Bacteriovoracaceae bacterium]